MPKAKFVLLSLLVAVVFSSGCAYATKQAMHDQNNRNLSQGRVTPQEYRETRDQVDRNLK